MPNEAEVLNVAAELVYGPMTYAHGQTGPYAYDQAVLTLVLRTAGLIQHASTRVALEAFCRSAITALQ